MMLSRPRVIAAVALCVCFWGLTSSTLTAQEPPGRPPQFRSGIDILRIDVSAIGEDGRPLVDLQAPDFTVEVDGRPLRVLFAHFSGSHHPGGPGSEPHLPAAYASNATTPVGRALAVVVDLESIRPGSEKVVLDTAARLIDSLGSNDAVSLVPIPGTSIAPTRDHRSIVDALGLLHGAERKPTTKHFFTIDEAVAFERKNKRVIDEVIERECGRSEAVAQIKSGSTPSCPIELNAETRERLSIARALAQAQLTGISAVADASQRIDGARTILLISGGLPFEPESLTWFRQAERALKQAGVLLYAVHLDQPDANAASRYRPGTDSYALRDLQSGLANVATMSGGAFFAGVGTAASVFERLRSEIAYSYELGVEALPQDVNAKPRKVQVSVNRPAARVRTRPELVVAAPVVDPEKKLGELISQPFDVPQLPITTVAQTVRGLEATTVKVIVIAEIGRGVVVQGPVRYALIFRQGETQAFQTGGTATQNGEAAQVLASAQLKPGRYRLRIAAVDGDGRGGALETSISVGIRAAGDLQLSDLLLGASGEPFTPALHLQIGQPLAIGLELYTAEPARFQDATVAFELRGALNAPVLSAPGELHATDAERRRVALATLATSSLQAGEYQVSAVVTSKGQPMGKVSRAIVLLPGVAAATSEPAIAAPPEEIHVNTPDAALQPVMRRVAAYVAGYGEKASAIVAVEKYTQSLSFEGASTQRRVVAEFALVKSAGPVGWLGYRDVVEVDGDAVRDRRDRLMKLVTESSAPSSELTRISNESARYNMGPVLRNFNVPTTALFFFHPANVERFTFTRKGTRAIDGILVWEIAFRETRKPTMMMTRAGKDVPCEGTLWVSAEDGTVLRTRLRLRGFADAMKLGESGADRIRVSEYNSPSPSPAPSPQTQTSGGSTGGQGGGGTSTGGTGSSGGSGSGTGQGGTQSTASSGGTAGSTAGESRRPTPSFSEFDMTRLESRADIEVTYQRDDRLGMWLPSRMSEEYEGPIPRIRSAPILGSTRTIATYSDFKQFGTAVRVGPPKNPD